MTSGRDKAANDALAGEVIFVLGRLHGVTRKRLDHLVAARGGKLAGRASPRTTMVVVAHSAAGVVLPDGTMNLPVGLPQAAVLTSENDLRRRLGLLSPAEPTERSLAAADIQRVTGLSPTLVACLALFDVLEPESDRFSYRDMLAAREIGRLVQRGVDIRQILEASMQLLRRGHHVAEARLVESSTGELFRSVAGQLAELSGQLTMTLDSSAPSVDELFAAAEKAEDDGDLATAESLYATALRADQTDPVLPFNLGNVFDAQGRIAEAKVAWQIAVARDPGFADAWYNLALAAEDEDQNDLAIAQYRRAIKAYPDYADAHFNLALLLTRQERCSEALPLWDRVLDLEPRSEHANTARRAAALCRMQIAREQSKAG